MPETIISHEGIDVIHIDYNRNGDLGYLKEISKENHWCSTGPTAKNYLSQGPMCYVKRSEGEKKRPHDLEKYPGLGLWWPTGNQWYAPFQCTTISTELHRELATKGIYRMMKEAGVYDETSDATHFTEMFPNNPEMKIPGDHIQFDGIRPTRSCLFDSPAIALKTLDECREHPALAYLWYWHLEKRDDLIPAIASNPIVAYNHAIGLQGRFIEGEPAIVTVQRSMNSYLHYLSSRQLAKGNVRRHIEGLREEFLKNKDNFIDRMMKTVSVEDKPVEIKSPSKRSQKKAGRENRAPARHAAEATPALAVEEIKMDEVFDKKPEKKPKPKKVKDREFFFFSTIE